MIPGKGDLGTEDIRLLMGLLSDSITEYDCGDLCRQDNPDGTPYCCQADNAVPLLFRSELAYLQSLGDIWSIWEPESEEEKRLLRKTPSGQIFCSCKGHGQCDRKQRSISCRSFPLEPYMDIDGNFIGFTFIRDFTDKDPQTDRVRCPLTNRREDIRQEFVDCLYSFWMMLMMRRNIEYDTYQEASERLRKDFRITGKRFHILFPSHIEEEQRSKSAIFLENP